MYGNKLEQPELFFKEARANDITQVLNEYFQTGITENCCNLLKVIKADLLVLEYIAGRRELNN